MFVTQLLLGLFTIIAITDCWTIEKLWIVSSGEAAVLHNEKRNLHKDTNPLVANFGLSLAAQSCIKWMIENNKYVGDHPCDRGTQGENIYLGTHDANGQLSKELLPATFGWYNEIRFVDFSKNDYYYDLMTNSAKVGHLTQMLWASTSDVGCAGGSYLEGSFRKTILLCRYTPQGNYFYPKQLSENVHQLKPLACKDDSNRATLCNLMKPNPTKYCNGPLSALAKQCRLTCNLC